VLVIKKKSKVERGAKKDEVKEKVHPCEQVDKGRNNHCGMANEKPKREALCLFFQLLHFCEEKKGGSRR